MHLVLGVAGGILLAVRIADGRPHARMMLKIGAAILAAVVTFIVLVWAFMAGYAPSHIFGYGMLCVFAAWLALGCWIYGVEAMLASIACASPARLCRRLARRLSLLTR